MEKEINEFNQALRDLRTAVHGLHRQTLETRDAMGRLVDNSHLRTIIRLNQEDVFFRRLVAV